MLNPAQLLDLQACPNLFLHFELGQFGAGTRTYTQDADPNVATRFIRRYFHSITLTFLQSKIVVRKLVLKLV